MIKNKLAKKLDLGKCEFCDDEYCVIFSKALMRKCVFCDQVCKNPICENKHMVKKCDQYMLYILENC
jgi:hypothetical protein